MGSTINPLFASLYAGNLVPGGMNPTGNQLSMNNTAAPASTGANPLLPSTPMSTASSGSTNPFGIVPGSSGLSFPANSASGYSSSLNLGGGGAGALSGPFTVGSGKGVGLSNPNSPFSFLQNMPPGENLNLLKGLNKVYGQGLGNLIYQFLQSGAGFNQQAVNNLLASLGPGIERGQENIMEQFSATGNRFGSPAATGLGDFLSQVNLNEGEIVSQMYQTALDNFMSVMMGTAGQTGHIRAGSPSGLDKILQGFQLFKTGAGAASAGAGGLSSIISAIAPGADTGVLDAIAAGLAFA